jgi:hypothetical protein
MDKHLKKLGPCVLRTLETVWFVAYAGTQDQLFQYVSQVLSDNDRVLVISASNCKWRNLLVSDQQLQNCWNK